MIIFRGVHDERKKIAETILKGIEPGSKPLLNETLPPLQLCPPRQKTGSTSVHDRLRPTSAAFRAGVGLRMMGMLGLRVDGDFRSGSTG